MLNTALLDAHPCLAVALSGGSDSTALLVLAVEALGADRVRAVTVNHGLRAAAADEARHAGRLCTALGVKHDVLTLALQDGADLQARARAGRYGAMATWAKENDIDAIALGHTQGDVAETFLMRLARGSGVDGLACMPERFEKMGATFVRPLLEATRGALRDMLSEKSITWSEDPSNEDPRFTRVQMRQAMPELEALGLTSAKLSQTARWMRAASDVLENAADDWISKHAIADYGDAIFDQGALEHAPEETACRVLARALCNISGNPYRPRLSALNALRKSTGAATLHGCLIYPDQGSLRITRELNAIKGYEDNRWTIEGPMEASHRVAPLGPDGLAQIENWRETSLLPRRSVLASPAIWQGAQIIAAPLALPVPGWSAHAANPLARSK